MTNELTQLNILIPDGGKNFSIPVINCLSKIPGLKIDILSDNKLGPSRYSFHLRNYRFHPPIQDPHEWMDFICQVAIDYKVDVILPVDQPAIRVLSKHRDHIPDSVHTSPLPPLESFDTAANKWTLADHLNRHHIPTPRTLLFRQDDAFATELSSIPFPVLTKSLDGKGGRGIQYWENKSDLMGHLERYGKPNQLIVQKFIRGHFAGCNVLCHNGKILAHTAQKGLLPPRHRFGHPEDIQMVVDDNILEIVKQLMASLNWSGVANIDLCYDEEERQYKILEINPRFWGTMLGSLIVGVNFPYLASLAGMDVSFPIPAYKPKPYLGGIGAIKFITRRKLPITDPPLRIEDSIISHFLSDPLPMIVRWSIKFFKWIFKIKN